ncbi:MAG: PAS domain S-box protein [Elusimicrobia bacterium]|nr:PAS domain S-box protein [Elusimicrobiota bacterium]
MINGQGMLELSELKQKIAAGGFYFIAADESLLTDLPKGDWIGGTTPYFMTDNGGLQTRDKAYVLELPKYVTGACIKIYTGRSLASVYRDAPENGFSLITMPASSPTHLSFALNAHDYDDFAASPLAGWIAGVRLEDIGKATPKVFDGRTGNSFTDAAAVMHVSLPKGRTAVLGIINIFEPGDGDVLTFEADGFNAKNAFVNGRSVKLARYLASKKLDTRLPLVADYGGAMINVSFQSVNETSGDVSFFAPVFKGVEYRHAKSVGEYLRAFMSQKPQGIEDRLMFSCNCILNYRHSGLEGRRTTGFTGPITFGEVAYQLLNQTAVYMEIVTANLAERLRTETALRRQNRLLGTLMDTIPDPVFYKDESGRLLGCNRAYEELAGLPKAKILGRTVRELFPAEIADVYTRKNNELLAAPGTQTYELDFPGGDGGSRSMIVRSATFPGAGGGVGGIAGVIRDVTDLRRANDELKLFRDLLESSSDAVLIIFPGDGRLLDVNVSACEMLGRSRPELLKMRFPETRADLPADYDWRAEAERIKAAPSLLMNLTNRRSNGDTFPAEANVKYVALSGKEYLVAIMRDISGRRKMEAALKEVSTLQGLIPICANCKKIRNDKGYWERVETYISQRSEAKFSHGLCESCIDKLYGNEKWFKDGEKPG